MSDPIQITIDGNNVITDIQNNKDRTNFKIGEKLEQFIIMRMHRDKDIFDLYYHDKWEKHA